MLTWPLWQARVYLPLSESPQPPLLPLVSLPQLDMGPWLLASLIVVLIVPRWGILLHAVLLALAILMDQTRLQPEFISLLLLMVGSLDSPSAKLLARSHLLALWFYAGLHKLLSPGYFSDVVPYMLGGVSEKLSPRGMNILGALAALGEMSLAVLAIVPRTRRACAVMAGVFHTSILLWLSLRLHWNSAVWPWNAALAVAGPTLIWPWKASLRAAWQDCRPVAKSAAAFVLISPVGYYFGLIGAPLAHCLYTSNAPTAEVIPLGGESVTISDLLPTLNVFLPPMHHTFEAYFAAVGHPGDQLIIDDPRWWAKVRGFAHREIVMPAAASP